MKAKKFLMAFAAIAAISTVSCTQDEELLTGSGNGPTPDGDAVTFGTYLAGAPESRASVMDLPALKTTGFGVFGYYTESVDYKTENPDHLPNFMYNQEVTWNDAAEGGMWQYSPVKYWPNNPTEKVSFFAYAPYVETPEPPHHRFHSQHCQGRPQTLVQDGRGRRQSSRPALQQQCNGHPQAGHRRKSEFPIQPRTVAYWLQARGRHR